MSQSADHPAVMVRPEDSASGEESSHSSPHLPWGATWIVILTLSAAISAALVFAAHGSRGFFLPILAAVVCILAALFDARTGRIPNPLTYTAILLGLGLNALSPLLHALPAQSAAIWLAGVGPQASLMGFAVCAAIGLFAALLAGMHGGDLKLLAAIGSLLGLTQTGNVLIVALATALAYSIINLAVAGRLNDVVRLAATRLLELIYLRHFPPPAPDDATPSITTHIPMAVPLAIGLVFVQYWDFYARVLFL